MMSNSGSHTKSAEASLIETNMLIGIMSPDHISNTWQQQVLSTRLITSRKLAMSHHNDVDT